MGFSLPDLIDKCQTDGLASVVFLIFAHGFQQANDVGMLGDRCGKVVFAEDVFNPLKYVLVGDMPSFDADLDLLLNSNADTLSVLEMLAPGAEL